MRGRLAAALLGLCVLSQGCGPLAETARTMILEPVEYPRRLEACVDWKRAEAMTEAAWADYLGAHADGQCSISSDFGQGFRAGYADYLFAGGTGNPPPLAPRCYWRAEYKTPEGRLGEQDWFLGFRTGAAAAKLSGYREIETVGTWTSVSRTPVSSDGAYAPTEIPIPAPATPETRSAAPGADQDVLFLIGNLSQPRPQGQEPTSRLPRPAPPQPPTP